MKGKVLEQNLLSFKKIRFYNYLIWFLERDKIQLSNEPIKKNGNWTSVYLKYLPHGSAQWRDNENRQTLKYSKKSNLASLCEI